MEGFKLDEQGDLVVRGGALVLAQGAELEAQTARMLVGTNRGEWWLNEAQGIHFANVLVKNPNPDLIRGEIQQALLMLDSSYAVEAFEAQTEGRRLAVRFTASNGQGRSLRVEKSY